MRLKRRYSWRRHFFYLHCSFGKAARSDSYNCERLRSKSQPHWDMMTRYDSFFSVAFYSLFLKDTLKALDNFRNKKQNFLKWCFLIYKSIFCYILKMYSIYYRLRSNANCIEIPYGQNKRFKKCPFASSNSSHFYFSFHSYMSRSTRFVSLKLWMRFSIFDPFRFY